MSGLNHNGICVLMTQCFKRYKTGGGGVDIQIYVVTEILEGMCKFHIFINEYRLGLAVYLNIWPQNQSLK
jgi:hypothetical protein